MGINLEQLRREREQREREQKRQERERITKKEARKFEKDLASMKETDNEIDSAFKKLAKDIDEVEQSLEDRIIGFDKNHVPKYSREYLAKNCPQRDDKNIREQREKSFARIIRDTAKNNLGDRTDINRYRVCLTKDKRADLEEILGKTARDFDYDKVKGRAIPELILVSPNGEIDGVPVPVDVYLKENKIKTLNKDSLGRDGRENIIEAVYNKKSRYELEYERSVIKERVPEKDKDHGKEKEDVKVKDGRVIRNRSEEEELLGEKMRKDDEIIDKDKWEFDGAGVNRDVTVISDIRNMDTQKSRRIAQAYEAEQDRIDDIDTHQEVPEAVQDRVLDGEAYHDSPYSINPQKGEDGPEWKVWEQEQIQNEKAEESIWSAKDFEDLNFNGIDDTTEPAYYEDLNGNGIPDIEEPKQSWRDKIEEQDRAYWEEDMERKYGE